MLTRIQRFLHVGQKVLNHKLTLIRKNESEYVVENQIDSTSIFSKKTVVVSIPGAFTPTCSSKHVPQFISQYDKFKAKGVEVFVLAVNDAFVMKRFAEDQKSNLPFICDGSGLLTKSLDAGLDLTEKGLGFRSRRFSIVVEDNVVKVVNDEESGAFTEVSSADRVLSQI